MAKYIVQYVKLRDGTLVLSTVHHSQNQLMLQEMDVHTKPNVMDVEKIKDLAVKVCIAVVVSVMLNSETTQWLILMEMIQMTKSTKIFHSR